MPRAEQGSQPRISVTGADWLEDRVRGNPLEWEDTCKDLGSHSDGTQWEILSKEIIFKIFSSLLNYSNSYIVLKDAQQNSLIYVYKMIPVVSLFNIQHFT